MHWIIPIGGKGSRTKTLGEFKPFIEINSQKILFWFFLSIRNNLSRRDKITFITTKDFLEKFDVADKIKEIFSTLDLSQRFQVLTTLNRTSGVSSSLYLLKSHFESDGPVAVINPDQYIDFDLPLKIPPKSAFLSIYAEFSNKSGYVNIENGLITNFVEKKNISNLASSGVFIVSNGEGLINAIEKQLEDELSINGEYYLGPAFNYLIQGGYKIYPFPVRVKYDLGDISEIEHFSNTPLAISLGKIFAEERNLSEAYREKNRPFLFV